MTRITDGADSETIHRNRLTTQRTDEGSGQGISPTPHKAPPVAATIGAHPKPATETAEEILARTLLRPSIQASMSLTDYYKEVGETSLEGVAQELVSQCQAASRGDMRRVEAMLVSQAHTLDAIFNNLARRASRAEHTKHLDVYVRLALKAQNQCRATIDTLANIKNPRPVAFVGQANISSGPQQINNGISSPPSDGSIKLFDNELLEPGNGKRLDP